MVAALAAALVLAACGAGENGSEKGGEAPAAPPSAGSQVTPTTKSPPSTGPLDLGKG